MLKSNNSWLLAAAIVALALNGCSEKKSNLRIGKISADSSALPPSSDSKKPSTDTAQAEFSISLEGYKATPLGQAVYSGDTSKVRALIEQGASIEKCLTDETYEFDILYTSLVFNKTEMARYVLRNRLYTSVNETYTEESENPLTLACSLADSNEALEIAKALVDLGASVNGTGESGGEQTKYPIIISVSRNTYGLTKMLLEHGASLEIKDKYGKAPLSIAQEKGFKSIADLLKGN